MRGTSRQVGAIYEVFLSKKGLNPLFIVLRKSTFYRITMLHLINSDYFVVNERFHLYERKTHVSFSLFFIIAVSMYFFIFTNLWIRPFWK